LGFGGDLSRIIREILVSFRSKNETGKFKICIFEIIDSHFYFYLHSQWRAAISDSNWEKEEEKIRGLMNIAENLVDAHRYKEVKKEDLYASKMLFQSAVKRLETLIDANNVTATDEHKSGILAAYLEVRDSLKEKIAQLENIQAN
jgi:hypothetical protein